MLEDTETILTNPEDDENRFSLFVPINDEMMKSVEVDENGDYIVQGVVSSEAKDIEGDEIVPEGMDVSYFLEKGWIKYEHSKDPRSFIGEPIGVRVGAFKHPKTGDLVKGVHVKARLFSRRALTKQAVEAMQDLQKSNTKRTMGWSIEGGAKERCKKTGRILKSVLRNVVLTMNPVNTTTWAELCKSFAPNHQFDEMAKSMTIDAAAEVTPQSLEGAKCACGKEDCNCATERMRKLLRAFLGKVGGSRKLQKSFMSNTDNGRMLMAYSYAVYAGMGSDEADFFASYISQKQDILKSLITTGGEKMAKAKDLLTTLDGDLDALKKALNGDNEEAEDDGEGEGGEAGDGDNKEEDDEDEATNKSVSTDLRKSLETDHAGAKEALEVSDFLSALVDEVGLSLGGMEKSLMSANKQNAAAIQAVVTMGGLVKSLGEQVTELHTMVEEVLKTPQGRRGVVDRREVHTLVKGQGASEDGDKERKPLNRTQLVDELCKAVDAGKIPGSVVTRFEAGVPINKLGIPDDLCKSLGI